jgi:acetyltransferase-like isoleucine patch superfamily enzyme
LKTEKQKMLAGELYRPDAELGAEQAAAKVWMTRYNAALASSTSERHALLCERLGHVGKDAVIRPPFFCDYGYNIRLGDGVFLNFNCVILDVVEVTIGDRTQIGPAVQIYTAGADRQRCLDRRRRHHTAQRHDRRRCGYRGRQRGDAGRRRRRYRHGKSGSAAAEVTDLSGFAIYPSPCYGKPMFARRTIPISGPAFA